MNEFFGGYEVDFNKFKRCSTFNYCTAIQTKMVKICFDWNQCKSLHKQSLSKSFVQVANNSTKGNKYIFGHGLNSQIVQELSI